jgi:hypothetical protein
MSESYLSMNDIEPRERYDRILMHLRMIETLENVDNIEEEYDKDWYFVLNEDLCVLMEFHNEMDTSQYSEKHQNEFLQLREKLDYCLRHYERLSEHLSYCYDYLYNLVQFIDEVLNNEEYELNDLFSSFSL